MLRKMRISNSSLVNNGWMSAQRCQQEVSTNRHHRKLDLPHWTLLHSKDSCQTSRYNNNNNMHNHSHQQRSNRNHLNCCSSSSSRHKIISSFKVKVLLTSNNTSHNNSQAKYLSSLIKIEHNSIENQLIIEFPMRIKCNNSNILRCRSKSNNESNKNNNSRNSSFNSSLSNSNKSSHRKDMLLNNRQTKQRLAQLKSLKHLNNTNSNSNSSSK